MYCCCNIAITLTIRGCGRHSMARVGHGGVENRSIAEPTRGVTAKPKHPKIDGTFQPNAVPGMTRRIASGAKQFAEKLIFGLSVASNEFSRFGPGCGFPTCCRRSFCCRTWYFSANCKAEVDLAGLAARLKSCPDTNRAFSESCPDSNPVFWESCADTEPRSWDSSPDTGPGFWAMPVEASADEAIQRCNASWAERR